MTRAAIIGLSVALNHLKCAASNGTVQPRNRTAQGRPPSPGAAHLFHAPAPFDTPTLASGVNGQPPEGTSGVRGSSVKSTFALRMAGNGETFSNAPKLPHDAVARAPEVLSSCLASGATLSDNQHDGSYMSGKASNRV